MSVVETGVSYYGLSYPEHARKDFLEMINHNCNAVVLALSEFDIDFWFPNIVEVAKVARGLGLKVYLDPWGIGKWFGGEPPSIFLNNNSGNRQVSALSGEMLPAACFNTKAFRDYFFDICGRLATNVDADGFFWDEPHYALPKSYASITGGAGDDWTCMCPVCTREFERQYGYKMPRILTREVVAFRENQAMDILRGAAGIVRQIRPTAKIICCVHATINSYYVKENRGYDNWDKVAGDASVDVFSTTILSYRLPRDFFRMITERTVEVARKYGKGSQRWLMNYYQEPADPEDIRETVRFYNTMGVESLFAWTYRGGAGTVLGTPRSVEMWDALGEAYGEVLSEGFRLKSN